MNGLQIGVLVEVYEVALGGLLQATTASDWKRTPPLNQEPAAMSFAISRTRRWKGSFRIRSSVLFWYLLISLSATVTALLPDSRRSRGSCFPPIDFPPTGRDVGWRIFLPPTARGMTFLLPPERRDAHEAAEQEGVVLFWRTQLRGHAVKEEAA